MKLCQKCGAKLADDVIFCTECGAQQPAPQPYAPGQPAPQPTAGKFCKNCGAQNPQDMMFCMNCGTPFADAPEQEKPQDAGQPKERKKPSKQLLAVIAGVVVALVLVILIASAAGSGDKSFRIADPSLYLVPSNDGGTILLSGDTIYKDICDGASIGPYYTAANGSAGAVVTQPDSAFYVLTEDGAVKVDDDVDRACISDDGSAVLYVTDDGKMILYNVAKGEKTTICRSDAYYGVLSPNGKKILYCTVDEADEEDVYTLYMYDGKESTELDEGLIPISISNNGKCIYAYSRDNTALYAVDKSGEREKISSVSSSRFCLSADHTEILFFNEGSYISVNGGERMKISSSSLWPESCFYISSPKVSIYVCNSSLVDQLYFSYSEDYWSMDLYYLTSDYSSEKIAGSISYYSTCDDYSVVYYVKNDKLYCAVAKDAYEPEKIDTKDGVESVYVSDDGSRVYYLTADGDLYYVKNSSTSEKAASDVTEGGVFYGKKLYFISDDTLYYADKANREKVDTEVYYVFVASQAVYYITEDGDLYGSTKGEKFERLARDIAIE